MYDSNPEAFRRFNGDTAVKALRECQLLAANCAAMSPGEGDLDIEDAAASARK